MHHVIVPGLARGATFATMAGACGGHQFLIYLQRLVGELAFLLSEEVSHGGIGGDPLAVHMTCGLCFRVRLTEFPAA